MVVGKLVKVVPRRERRDQLLLYDYGGRIPFEVKEHTHTTHIGGASAGEGAK